jgi:transcriptional regulator with XRE-family HTH domain
VARSRLAGVLRSARERAGWSREALAYHSGLSWAAITQIEAGRRQEVRTSSLLALANALGVTVDYLVGGEATVSPKLLRHRVLIYSADEQYLAFAVPFVIEGLKRSDSLLAVTARRQIDLLRDALADEAARVQFRDSSEWYSSPHRALTDYRAFVKEQFARGAPWVRIIGEPVWSGRSEGEIAEWTQYESILNLSFASSPATIVCPYDARSVPEGIIAGARQTHPELVDNGDTTPSLAYQEPEDFLLKQGPRP